MTRKVVFLRPLGLRLCSTQIYDKRDDFSKSDRSHVVLWAKELTRKVVFLRPLGLRAVRGALPTQASVLRLSREKKKLGS